MAVPLLIRGIPWDPPGFCCGLAPPSLRVNQAGCPVRAGLLSSEAGRAPERGVQRMGQMPSNRLEAYMPIGDLEGKRDFSFQDIRGFKILNTTGHKVGTVKDIFVDPNTLEPCFVFLHYEKLLGFLNHNLKHLLVPWGELLIGEEYVQTRWTEEELTPQTRAEQA